MKLLIFMFSAKTACLLIMGILLVLAICLLLYFVFIAMPEDKAMLQRKMEDEEHASDIRTWTGG